MAPMIQAMGVCLVALCTVQAVRAEVTADDAPEGMYLSVNLARRGKIDNNLAGLVEKDSAIVDTVKAALPAMTGEDDTCAKAGEVTSATAEGFVLKIPFDTQEPNFKELVQQALTEGLQALGDTLPKDNWGAGIWSTNDKATNLGYLLWSGSTKVGCAITKGCTAGNNLVLCRFTPTATKDAAPFNEDYFKALKERKDSLKDMTADDLESASSMAVPSVLLASLVVALAMASV